jgi:fucose 4-O-acetylase-like acetyltransferase
MLFVKELRRRNVLRMAVLYAVAAWLIVQVAGVLSDLAKLPDWIGTTTLWLLAVGFPIALIFSWF